MSNTINSQQRTFIIHLSIRDKEHPYGMYNFEARDKAIKELTPTAMLVWYQLSGNQNGYKWDCSPQYLQNKMGISESSVKRAINQMKELGYLVETGTKKYNFYEFPIQKELTVDTKNQKESMAVQKEPTTGSKRTDATVQNELRNTINNKDSKTKLQEPVMDEIKTVETKEKVENWQLEVIEDEYQNRFYEDVKSFARRIPICGRDNQVSVVQIQKLRNYGRSYEWIAKGLILRKDSEWLFGGFGLLLGKLPSCLEFQKKIKITVPVEYKEAAKDELYTEPQKEIVVDRAALENRRSEQQEKSREATGLYDLNTLFEM